MVDLVTGGAGFIGSHLVDRLIDEGRRVRVLDNFAVGRRGSLKQHEGNSRLEIVEADISDAGAVDGACAGVERIFHLAARADIVPSIQQPEAYFRANVDGTFAVLEASRRHGASRLVYVASSSCYGIPTIYPTPETASADCRYPYALTKYLGEQIVMHWARVYRLPAVSVRFFNVYGPRARTSGTYGAVFGVFLAQLLAGVPLTIVGNGEQTRDFTFVSDAVEALLTVAASDKMGEIYNVGSGRPASINELVRLLGSPPSVNIPKRPGEPDCTWADISKISTKLGWEPKVSFAEGVRVMRDNIHYWQDAPVWTASRIAEATSDWFRFLDKDMRKEGGRVLESNVAKLNRQPIPTLVGPRDKVRTLDEIARITEHARATGKVVVQAHGTFDLLHLGHIRHLEAARKLGDVLVVTVTADRFVNKGPGRPVFNAEMRGEMLATLEYVDWVAINDAADAVNAIEQIRPSIYIKGQDYQNPQGDVTGKITLERAGVEAHGGRIHFTDEVTYSSTELINRHLNVFEPHIREHLDALRQDGGLNEFLELIDRVGDYRVLVVGDAIIDEYQYVLPMHKTPKENMIATRYQDRELFAGGVFAAANHVASFCKHVDVVTCLGEIDSHQGLIRQSLRTNVGLREFTRPGAPTTLKRRFVDPSYMRKLFEVYFMNDEPLTWDVQNEVDRTIAEMAPEYDVVIAADFGHGIIGKSSIEALTKNSRFLAVNTQSNSANLGFNLITRYDRADYICIDLPEARLAVSDRLSVAGDIARRLIEDMVDCSKIIVTQGKHGCVTLERGGVIHTIPAFAKNVIDTVGAGDAFLAVTAPLVAAGGPMHQVGFIGNVVGALKVEIVGHRRSIEKSALIKAITGLLK